MPKYFKLYLAWSALVIVLVFAKTGFTTDNITHFFILVYLGLSLLLLKKKKTPAENPKRQFILLCTISAAVVEGLYMIQMPVFPALRVIAGMTMGQILRNYAIDLAFTIPAYFVIFRVIWFLINKYQYNVWQYAILMALGQALGDGSRTFLANPGLLVFLPYVLINYHAMNLSPYLKIQNTLPVPRSSSFFKYLSPLIILPLVYVLCGLVIYTLAAFFKIK
ncbi:MAG: hypothetical protein M1333_00425 [Patescibacteria group bacterium]|nr:hypothetical protein [Patescibacteria group bacterium]